MAAAASPHENSWADKVLTAALEEAARLNGNMRPKPPLRPFAPEQGEDEDPYPGDHTLGDLPPERPPPPSDPPPAEPAAGPNEADDDPHRLARLALARHAPADLPAQHFWRGEHYRWDGYAYRTLPEKELRAELCQEAKAEFDRLNLAAAQNWDGKGRVPTARRVTGRLVADVVHAVAGLTVLPGTVEPPAWLGAAEPFPAAEAMVCRNTIVHLPSVNAGRARTAALTPRLFTLNALDYAFDAKAARPVAWLDFLSRLWPGDAQAVEALQEWFGYCLLPDTSQQKILLVVGPKRSGKGTIARVLTGLVGIGNTCAPTLAGLGSHFGLWPLLGKTVAVISDARLSGRTDAAVVVERLLSVSGEDAQTIDRKNLPHVTCKLPVRFVVLTNELPRVSDPSGALVSRFIVLRLTQNWYGREDTGLTTRLLAELPGVLLWAVEGLRRLRGRGYFVQPKSGEKLIDELEDLASPIGAFLRECCEVGPGYEVFVRDLFDRWKRWCEEKGRKDPGAEQTFGRDLRAALPAIDTRQQRTGGEVARKYVGVKERFYDPIPD
jgi:putative DNA primase/helicase